MKRIGLFLLPLALFLFVTLFLLQGLYSDPRERESSLLERQVPAFTLPDVMDETTQYNAQVFQGQVTLLNVWGTWCVTCAIELPFLTQLKEQGVRIVGLYYEQDLDPDFGGKSLPQIQQSIRDKLSQLGDPYEFNIFDVSRDYSIDLGVTGAPETFLIDREGRIRLHHVGDLNPRIWEQKFLPLYQELMGP
ncbi:DsbE family thiol:disulfide interchange protein [Aliiglaciecola sp. CAU 1673]|uniref:DsbE family thiol:disulfide interchange protein n=1 Tax=Aliiglaciecola sp. CAU 1673 TaxID=3032595 RepID=UPI0023DB49B3|nr:DsbE family thiol:disulfide interchange protein [Aliiglaciecola sp. CAU 1673]MDF2177491.1 DsbE family thiol:disulfide interchange protein [Aliiglaciecola sp. CAU 1673]